MSVEILRYFYLERRTSIAGVVRVVPEGALGTCLCAGRRMWMANALVQVQARTNCWRKWILEVDRSGRFLWWSV